MELLVLCIGNRQGGDDSVGPYIADRLKEENFEKVVDCETVPENYTSIVKQLQPDNLVIIDAIDMGLEPGEIRVVAKEKIGVMHISTHGIPLSVLIDYLEKHVNKISLIGVQPKAMQGKLSDIVKKSAKKVIKIIKDGQLESIKTLN